MKLTESRIKEIILKKSKQCQKTSKVQMLKRPSRKTLTDVANMFRYIEKIDNVKIFSITFFCYRT